MASYSNAAVSDVEEGAEGGAERHERSGGEEGGEERAGKNKSGRK